MTLLECPASDIQANAREGLRRVTTVDPADFYTGIVAELYGPLKSFSQDPEPYAAFIRQAGMPTLELGCGEGRPSRSRKAAVSSTPGSGS